MVYALLLSTILSIMLPLINCQPGGGGTGPGGDTGNTVVLCDIDGANATYSEEISGDLRIIQASGCPNHRCECIGKPDFCEEGDLLVEASVKNKNLTIPAYPCFNNYTDTSSFNWEGYPVYCLLESLGIALNGVSIFSPSANQECKDANGQESDGWDYCGGHAGPTYLYHYHAAPACLLDQMGDSADTVDGHSPQIGWAFDGFPVYGPHGLDGEYVLRCTQDGANSSDCVDNCSGHRQHTIDGFKYHYHIAGPVGDVKTNPLNPVPSTDRYPYTFGCYMGIPSDWSQIQLTGDTPNLGCIESGVTDEYQPQPVAGWTEKYVSPYRTTTTMTPNDDATTMASDETTMALNENSVYGLLTMNNLLLTFSLLITMVVYQ